MHRALESGQALSKTTATCLQESCTQQEMHGGAEPGVPEPLQERKRLLTPKEELATVTQVQPPLSVLYKLPDVPWASFW